MRRPAAAGGWTGRRCQMARRWRMPGIPGTAGFLSRLGNPGTALKLNFLGNFRYGSGAEFLWILGEGYIRRRLYTPI